jgi:hypothetical protein
MEIDILFIRFVIIHKLLWKVNKEWWSTIPPISTKPTITSYLVSLNRKMEIHILDWDRHNNVAGQNGGFYFFSSICRIVPLFMRYVLFL